MISEVVMPQMGADMVEGTLVRWIKQEGDEVTRGEIIAEIETDKANVEIEAFESGIFRKAIAQEGDVVPVGSLIGVIAGAEDDISKYANSSVAPSAPRPAQASSQPGPAAAPASHAPVAAAPAATPAGNGHAPPSGGRLRVSPVARRIADEQGIDVRTLTGTGPDGRIVKRDIEAAITGGARPAAAPTPMPQPPSPAPPPSAPAAATPVAMSRMRQAIARSMSQSKREAPHYYLLVDVDMTAAAAFRAQVNDTVDEDVRVSINDLIVRACALALRAHPMLNATIAGDQVAQHPEQNICIAIALDDGLIAPAIVDAGDRSLTEIATASKDLVERAKGGKLRAEEMTSGTFTITNLGAYGVETLIGIIQPPQTAILGVGSMLDQPAVIEGSVAVRKLMKIALSADHRVTDGAQGAQFLAEIKRLLEHPLSLVL